MKNGTPYCKLIILIENFQCEVIIQLLSRHNEGGGLGVFLKKMCLPINVYLLYFSANLTQEYTGSVNFSTEYLFEYKYLESQVSSSTSTWRVRLV